MSYITLNIRVKKLDGWTVATFPDDVERIGVHAGKASDGKLSITLTGVRSDDHNVIETGVLDIDPEDEDKLNGEVPRTDSGVALPVAERANEDE